MAYIDSDLQKEFDEKYELALKYKKAGEMKLFKLYISDASSIAAKQALYAKDLDVKREKIDLSKRLKAVAENISLASTLDEPKTKKTTTQGFKPSPLTGVNDSNPISIKQGEENQSEIDEEMSQFFEFIPEKDLKITFDDVIGVQEAKDQINELVVFPLKNPEAYHYKIDANKYIMLYGPAGTGKTTFAKALAKELKQPFVLVSPSGLVNALIGETGKNIDKVFAYLRDYCNKNNQDITIFFDEFDEIAKNRNSDDKVATSAVPALLRNLNGFKETKHFLILVNSNFPDALDPAILDRFSLHVLVDLPKHEDRIRLFKLFLNDVEQHYIDKLDFNLLAAESDTLSGRRIEYACNDFKRYLGKVNAGRVEEGNLTQVMGEFIRRQLDAKK